MRKRLIVAVAALVALLGAVAPASAIQYGQPDGTAHPYVGLVVFYDGSGTVLWRCSGTLISDEVFLTAGHCTESPAASAAIWFVPGPIIPAPGGYPYVGWDVTGTPYPNPEFTGSLTLPNTHDIGVVVLNAPRAGPYGLLPTEGVLDAMATQRGLQDETFTIVGYGRQQVKPYDITERTRYVATTHLVNLRSALTDGYNLHMSSNPGNWSGGTCFGDSGGPVFLGTSRTIVAVNSFVLNLNCKGAGFGYRVDIEESLDFVGSF